MGAGRVFGFLGPNGAGKTTAISVILGLLAASAGRVELFGIDSRNELSAALRRVGAIVENPAFYPHLSGRDNLRVWGAVAGGVTRARIDETLEIVGLRDRAGDKARRYSLGMKQRLGLAAALLNNPELLILDEPTNGLDPAGIREFRQLFRDLAAHGKTIFVSSHLLSEVEQMCDEVAILKEGRLIAQGEVGDLMNRKEGLLLRATDQDRAATVLGGLSWVKSVRADDDGSLLIEAPLDLAAEVSRALAAHEVWVAELRPQESTLEQFFLEVTGEAKTDG